MPAREISHGTSPPRAGGGPADADAVEPRAALGFRAKVFTRGGWDGAGLAMAGTNSNGGGEVIGPAAGIGSVRGAECRLAVLSALSAGK